MHVYTQYPTLPIISLFFGQDRQRIITKYHQNLEIKTYHKNNLFIYFMRKEKSTLISLQTLLIIFNIYTNNFFFSGLENIIAYFSFKNLIIIGPIKTSIGPYS